MEERNLELAAGGKIKLKKRNEQTVAEIESESGDEIVLDVPDFKGFEGEEPSVEEKTVQTLHAREEERAGRKGRAERLLAEADALYEAGDRYAAGEKYVDSAMQDRANWRAWFGVVRVQTKDLTDFSEIYDCETAYNAAFRFMPREERLALAERYVPRLTEQADALHEKSAEAEAEDARLREERAPAAKREFSAAVKFLAAVGVAFVACLAAAIVLWCSITVVSGSGILIGAIVCTVLAAVALVFTALAAKRFILARAAHTGCARPGSTDAGRRAAELTAEEELIRSVAADFQNGIR